MRAGPHGAWLAAGWAAVGLGLRPFQDVPFIDDWVYAAAVEHLLATGRLELLDYYGNPMHVQAIWGAAFCLPFGFSFTALRLSTWILALVAVAGMHRLLVEAGASRGGARLGAATLATSPIVFILSFTFMTEVPALALETWALAFFVRAWHARSDRSLWAGTACAAIGAGIRFACVVPALAMSAALLFSRGSWGRRRGRFLVASLVPVAVAAALAWYTASHTRHVADLTGIPNAPGPRLELLRQYALPLLPGTLLGSLSALAAVLGIATIPAAAGVGLARRHVVRAAIGLMVAAGASLAILAIGERPYALFGPGDLWSVEELGAARSFLPGWSPPAVPPALTLIATVIAWIAFALGAGSALRRGPRAARAPEADGAGSPKDAAGAGGAPVLWWTMGGLLLMTALLWLAYDRYLLPFVPPALALILGRGARVSWRRAAVPLVAMLAIVGTISGGWLT